MNVLLLYTDKYYLVNQIYPLGISMIASYLRKQGHKAEVEYPFLPDMDFKKNLRDAIDRIDPDFVGIGIRNLDTCMSCEQYGDFKGDDYQTFYFLPQVKDIVAEVKRVIHQVPIVVGGGGFTVSPTATLKYLGLRYGIIGEGENAFLQFIEAFPANEKISRIPNMVYARNKGYSINQRKPYAFEQGPARFHRESKFDFSYQTNGVPVVVKRGCNQACSYCVEPLIEGSKFVYRDIDDVLDELKTIAESPAEAGTIFFVDTEFNVPDSGYGSRLVEAILKTGLNERFRFVSQFIPKNFDLDFAKLLAKAGFSVVFSCESFSNTVLQRNGSSYQETEIIKAVEVCEKVGMHCTVTLIFGLPGETFETVNHTLHRMKEYPVGQLRSYEYTVGGRIYHGTPLCKYAEKNSQPTNLYGTKSDGYLLPYYYCAPIGPFELNKYINGVFPDLLSYQNKYEKTTHQCLGIAYLADQALWEPAVERFVQAETTVQSNIYDYLFKKLAVSQRQNEAKTISLRLLDNIERSKPVDAGQADIVRFYLSCLG